MSLRQEAVVALIEAFADPRTAYILGAGASAPDVPVMRELVKRVIRDFKDHVHGFIPPDETDSLQYRFADAAANDDEREMLLASNVETFRTLIARNLSPQDAATKNPPPQYKVLSMTNRQGPIINYNVDGLAGIHCGLGNQWPVHGELPQFVKRIPLESALRLTQEGIEIVPRSFWLPEPEYEEAVLDLIDPAYRELIEVPQVVIIGYSFGKNSDRFDDEVSFNALVEYFSKNNARVFVVDPHPRDLAECLAEGLNSLNVVPIPAYWDLLCMAFLEVINDHRLAGLGGLYRFVEVIVKRYEVLAGDR